MRFEADWQPEAPNASPEERATVADLRVFIGERNVCVNEQQRRRGTGGVPTPDRNIRRADCVTVSLVPLGEEIAVNWWHLFGSRDTTLRLVDGRGGYALPDVRLAFDGSAFTASCHPMAYENPPVRFTGHKVERLTRAEAEFALASFVESVSGRLAVAKRQDSGLQLQWERVQRSSECEDESAFCEAAGALGLDPYSIDDAAAASIEDAAAWFQGEPLLELLSGLRQQADRNGGVGPVGEGPRAGKQVLEWLRKAQSRHEAQSRLPAVDDLRQGMATMRQAVANEMPWSAGYRCAKEARRLLDIGAGERFRVSTLASRLGAPEFAVAGAVSGVRAVLETRKDATHVHLRTVCSRYRDASELFALGRAVGDAVVNPPAERSVINDLRDAARQAAGRAFAAEFLAPIDEIRSMREDGEDAASIASDLGVSKEVVERQIQNKERIREACAAASRA